MTSRFTLPFHKVRNIVMRNSPGAHKRRRVLEKFADKIGIIYFGLVDQKNDDHRVIRGVTASSSHIDNNFMTGTFEEYDVSLVDRQDITVHPTDAVIRKEWIILEIQLHTFQDIPHLFLGARHEHDTVYSSLFTSISQLKPVRLGTFEEYPVEFTNRYTLYSTPSHSIEAERIMSATMMRTIGAHFWPLSAEILGRSLYIYADHQQVTPRLLDMMLADGMWLAKSIDTIIDTL